MGDDDGFGSSGVFGDASSGDRQVEPTTEHLITVGDQLLNTMIPRPGDNRGQPQPSGPPDETSVSSPSFLTFFNSNENSPNASEMSYAFVENQLAQGVASLGVSTQGDSNKPVAKGGNAKDELHKYYDLKDGVSLLKKNKNFIAFREQGDQDHIPLWTCVFVSPEGLSFQAGKLLECENEIVHRQGMHWYSTKPEAMRAAAGRAIDCFLFRDRGSPPPEQCCLRHCEEIQVWPIPFVELPDIYQEAKGQIEGMRSRVTS